MSHPRDQMRHQVRRQVQQTWPALGSWQVQITQGSVRVGDAERDQAAHALGEHYAAGRLDRQEYDERVDLALAAKTRGELASVFRDLPSSPLTAARVRPPARNRTGHRLPFLPLLLILIGLAVVLNSAWVVWIGLGVVLLTRHAARRPMNRGF